jgi:hypothetical protein
VLRGLPLAVVLAGCFPAQEIDPAFLPDEVSIEGYTDWHRVGPLLGPAPGHGDSYRLLYVNDTARGYTGGGLYPANSVVVKEIYALDGEAGQGAFRYTAIMRRIDEEDLPGAPIMDGWLFTDLRDGVETQLDLCWDSCHRQAPYAGAWFDYGR